MSDFVDKEIICKECGTAFVWTASEQEFFASKGLVNMPSRCPICRKKADVKHDYTKTYDIECRLCHKKAKSPFDPADPKNVLCQECFEKTNAQDKSVPESEPKESDNAPESTHEAERPSDDGQNDPESKLENSTPNV